MGSVLHHAELLTVALLHLKAGEHHELDAWQATRLNNPEESGKAEPRMAKVHKSGRLALPIRWRRGIPIENPWRCRLRLCKVRSTDNAIIFVS